MVQTPRDPHVHSTSPWIRGKSDHSLRTSIGGVHLSIWRRSNDGTLHYTISGIVPDDLTPAEAKAYAVRVLLDGIVKARREKGRR